MENSSAASFAGFADITFASSVILLSCFCLRPSPANMSQAPGILNLVSINPHAEFAWDVAYKNSLLHDLNADFVAGVLYTFDSPANASAFYAYLTALCPGAQGSGVCDASGLVVKWHVAQPGLYCRRALNIAHTDSWAALTQPAGLVSGFRIGGFTASGNIKT